MSRRIRRLQCAVLVAACVLLTSCSSNPPHADDRTSKEQGVMQQIRLGPDQQIERPGMYYMRADSGALEGWTVPDDTLVGLGSSTDNRWVVAYSPGKVYLVDRTTKNGTVWNPQEVQFLGAHGNVALYVRDQKIWVAKDGFQTPTALTILPDGPQALFAPDGTGFFLLNGGKVYLVHSGSWSETVVLEMPAELQSTSMYATRGGAAVVVGYQTAAGYVAQLYSWQGEKLQELGSHFGAQLSPDGSLVAWMDDIAGVTKGVTVARVSDLKPLFQEIGADFCTAGIQTMSSLWVADSSGIVVRTSLGYRILQKNGNLADLPAAPGESAEPSPTQPNRFAVGRTKIVDGQGKILGTARLNLQGTGADLGGTAAWGENGDELRLEVMTGGRGGIGCDPLPLGPALNAPYNRNVALAVKPLAGDCLNVRPEPSEEARALVCLPAGSRLTPTPYKGTELSAARLIRPGIAQANTGRTWVHVQTEAGQTGWVAAEYLAWIP